MRGNNMADFIDLLTSSKYELKGNPASQLTAKLKEVSSPEELLKWFHITKDPVSGELYTEVSLDDCEKIIKNKDSLLKYGDLISAKNGY
jgi:hypothetical protein